MNKLNENKRAFVPFITCGYPDLKTTEAAVKAASENGADVIQLGIPFSDPTAEGPEIQEANIKALKGGITTKAVFEFLSEIRRNVKTPIVLTAYANVILSYGAENFISACKDADIFGIIVPDMPYEEKEEFLPVCHKYGVNFISCVSCGSESRIAMIAEEAEGFIYVAASEKAAKSGKVLTDAESIVAAVHKYSSLPCLVCRDNQPTTENYSDGVIGDLSILRIIEKYGKDAPSYIGSYVRQMKSKIR